jgi:GntR family negative regulator for fad regulon and positive regulator of fabA
MHTNPASTSSESRWTNTPISCKLKTTVIWSDHLPEEGTMEWDAPQKPAEWTETRLIQAILDGDFPINSTIPAERELASQLGVTRPTLRETLQRLARDGWVEIRQGRPTRVRNFWQEGNLGVLSALARYPVHMPDDFIPNLLTVRMLLAPAYTRGAVEHQPRQTADFLDAYTDLVDTPEIFADADWELHRFLTIASGNPVFTLILNGFHELYINMGNLYFATPETRAYSRTFYRDLYEAARDENPEEAERITYIVMNDTLALWQIAVS